MAELQAELGTRAGAGRPELGLQLGHLRAFAVALGPRVVHALLAHEALGGEVLLARELAIGMRRDDLRLG
ncbi:hypothetical protein D3C83_286090 [compost metagenome]